MDGKKLLIVGVLFMVLIAPKVFADFSYDETTETSCDEKGSCLSTIYSGFSPSFFKNVISKESNWLKFYDVVYLERDEKSDIIIKSFNQTSFDFELRTTEELKSATIPLKICDIDPEDKDADCYQMNYKLNAISRDHNLGIDLLERSYIKFGESSTTISIIANTVGLLDDSYIYVTYANNNYGTSSYLYLFSRTAGTYTRYTILKMNTSRIPVGATIEEAILQSYVQYNNLDSGEFFDIETHHVYNYPDYDISDSEWDESALTWNTRPDSSDEYNTTKESSKTAGPGDPVANNPFNLTVTNMLQKSVNDGVDNISIMLVATTPVGSAGPGDYITLYSKEYTVSNSYDSFILYVTYSIPADETSPTYSLNSTNSTIVGTDVKHSLYWNDGTGTLDTAIFSFDNCTGTLSNISSVSLSGSSGWSNFTVKINDTEGCTIQWCVYANDTSNNWNETSCDNPFSYITTTAGVDYNYSLNLSLGWSDQDYRTLDAVREKDLTISYAESNSRIFDAQRGSDLTITFTDSTVATALKIYSRLISLSLGWSDQDYRTLDAERYILETITFSDSSYRILDATRTGSATLSWSDNTYATALKVFQRLVSLSLGWSDNTYRTLDAERGAVQTITFSDIGSRILTANRGSSLSIGWVDSIYADVTTIYTRLISLVLGWSDSTDRTLDAVRESDLVLTFADNGIRIADLKRNGSLPISWSDQDYRTLDARKEIDLIITWLDVVSEPGAKTFVRLITLLIDWLDVETTYIRSWESVDPYEICAVLKQIGDSRAYLCIYQDASYKILIRGV